jgi:RsiW-degrading membrane proteinase PrsW (M82 family)
MQAIASLVFAIVPILLYVFALREMDRYDREPVGMLAWNFLWGAAAALALGLLAGPLLARAIGEDAWTQSVVAAPLLEETCKGAFLFWTVRSRHFDNITDGIVYGMAIGLGFAMTENFLYFASALRTEEWVARVIVRTLYTAVMHALATGVFGAFVGITKFNLPRLRWPARATGWLLAMLLHAAFNAFSHAGEGDATTYLVVVALALLLGVVQCTLFFENRLIRRELTEEAEAGLLNAVHIDYIASSSRRKMMGWLPPTVDRREYCQLATRLAFRKSQLRRCAPDARPSYEEEIARLREGIGALLHRERQSAAATLY